MDTRPTPYGSVSPRRLLSTVSTIRSCTTLWSACAVRSPAHRVVTPGAVAYLLRSDRQEFPSPHRTPTVARSHIQGGKNDAALMPVVRGMRCCFAISSLRLPSPHPFLDCFRDTGSPRSASCGGLWREGDGGGCAPTFRDVSVVLRVLRFLTSGNGSRDSARAVGLVSLPLGVLDAHHAAPPAHGSSMERTSETAVLGANRFGDDSRGVRHPAGVVRTLATLWAPCGWH